MSTNVNGAVLVNTETQLVMFVETWMTYLYPLTPLTVSANWPLAGGALTAKLVGMAAAEALVTTVTVNWRVIVLFALWPLLTVTAMTEVPFVVEEGLKLNAPVEFGDV